MYYIGCILPRLMSATPISSSTQTIGLHGLFEATVAMAQPAMDENVGNVFSRMVEGRHLMVIQSC